MKSMAGITMARFGVPREKPLRRRKIVLSTGVHQIDCFLEGGDGFFLFNFDYKGVFIIVATHIAKQIEHYV